jgi:phosphoribosylaminoimidazolecarboxamide formyltransferase/IMP cyclohydrolase
MAELPETVTLHYRRATPLRYGENPHQAAAVYAPEGAPLSGVFAPARYHGEGLSYCNLLDASAAVDCAAEFPDGPCAVVIKHGSPAGYALMGSTVEAMQAAIEGDPLSAFGGIIATNFLIDETVAGVITDILFDVIVAPRFSEGAWQRLSTYRKRIHLLETGQAPERSALSLKLISGALVVQETDFEMPDPDQWRLHGVEKLSPDQEGQIVWGLRAMRHIRSNTVIVIPPDRKMTIGIGSGQTSRVGAARIALAQAGDKAKGAYLLSDSFFPEPDSVQAAREHGIALIVQQGGSVRDKVCVAESLAETDELRAAGAAPIPMVVTGQRCFYHGV